VVFQDRNQTISSRILRGTVVNRTRPFLNEAHLKFQRHSLSTKKKNFLKLKFFIWKLFQASPQIWFERAESKDRFQVFNRLYISNQSVVGLHISNQSVVGLFISNQSVVRLYISNQSVEWLYMSI